ncbi:MAG: hypothetical protein LIP16_19090 [Clostridium sp.]|nr:hypothetical protein [Clostridium sp.]
MGSMLNLTPGTLLFMGGVGVLVLALVLTVITALTGKKRKKKLEERMKDRY